MIEKKVRFLYDGDFFSQNSSDQNTQHMIVNIHTYRRFFGNITDT